MDAVVNGYKAVSLLVWLNADRLFSLGTVLVGLLAGAFLGSALLQPWSLGWPSGRACHARGWPAL